VADHTVALSGGNPVAAALVHTPTVTIGQTNGAAANLSTAGYVSHCEGLIFNAGASANQADVRFGGSWTLKNCACVVNNTSSSSAIRATNAGTSKTLFDNVTVKFGATTQNINCQGGEFLWRNTANAVDVSGSLPTNFFGSSLGLAVIRGVDFSALTPGKTFLAAQAAGIFNMFMLNCKEPASWTRYTLAQTNDYAVLTTERSESGAHSYSKTKDDAYGQQTTETTIVRTGGAFDGTTNTSWKLNTATVGAFTAKVRPQRPFRSTPTVIWNDVISTNRVVTVYGVWGGGAVPNNDDIWLEIDYLGSGSFSIGTIDTQTTIATPLTTHAAVASDGSTWASSPGTAFKLVATLSSPQPAMKGPMVVRICVGAQSTFYIDWQPVLS
jgi:hypothetical protein